MAKTEKILEKTFRDLEPDIEVMLRAFRVPYKIYMFAKHLPRFFVISEFGTIIVGSDRRDQAEMTERLATKYPGFRLIFLYLNDKLTDKRYTVLWSLMRSGYLSYLRSSYNPIFQSTIQRENLGKLIIKERLRIWGNDPKYKYLVDMNKEALEYPPAAVLAREPGFYDMMPEDMEVTQEDGENV